MGKVFQYKGITDDMTECSNCGRSDLKATMVLAVLDSDSNETGEIVYMGRSCGAKALGWNLKDIDKQIRATRTEMSRLAEEQRVQFESSVQNHPTMVANRNEQSAYWNLSPRPQFSAEATQAMIRRHQADEKMVRESVQVEVN